MMISNPYQGHFDTLNHLHCCHPGSLMGVSVTLGCCCSSPENNTECIHMRVMLQHIISHLLIPIQDTCSNSWVLTRFYISPHLMTCAVQIIVWHTSRLHLVQETCSSWDFMCVNREKYVFLSPFGRSPLFVSSHASMLWLSMQTSGQT